MNIRKVSFLLFMLLLAAAIVMMTGCNLPQESKESQPLKVEDGANNPFAQGAKGWSNIALKELGTQQYLSQNVVDYFQDWWGNWQVQIGALLIGVKSNEWQDVAYVFPTEEDNFLRFKHHEDSSGCWYLCWPTDEDGIYPSIGDHLYYEVISKDLENYYMATRFPNRYYFSMVQGYYRPGDGYYVTLGCAYNFGGVVLNGENEAVLGNGNFNYWKIEL